MWKEDIIVLVTIFLLFRYSMTQSSLEQKSDTTQTTSTETVQF
jgi:hypothetical protein